MKACTTCTFHTLMMNKYHCGKGKLDEHEQALRNMDEGKKQRCSSVICYLFQSSAAGVVYT